MKSKHRAFPSTDERASHMGSSGITLQLEELGALVENLAKDPFLVEAWAISGTKLTLARWRALYCKVALQRVHLLKT